MDSCHIISCPYSDHSAVVLNCDVPDSLPHGPGRWKLNVLILVDPDLVASIKTFSLQKRTCKNSFVSLQAWWDRGKQKLKGICIKHCEQKAKVKDDSHSLLTNLADHLKSKIDLGQVSLLPIYSNVLNQISAFDLSDAQGTKLRSRVKWAEEDESSPRYFLRLEKKRGAHDWFSAMKNSDGSVVSDLDGICNSWVQFKTYLFTVEEVDLSVQKLVVERFCSSFL